MINVNILKVDPALKEIFITIGIKTEEKELKNKIILIYYFHLILYDYKIIQKSDQRDGKMNP